MRKEFSSSLLTAMNKIGDKSNISLKRKTITNPTGIHTHDFYEIEIVLNGNGTHILNGKSYSFKQGNIYILSPLDFHQIKPTGEIELYTVMFRENMLSQDFILTLLESKNRILFFDEHDFKEITSICHILETENNKQEKYTQKILKSSLESLLFILLRKMEQIPTGNSENQNNDINDAVLYMHRHFKENPTLTEVAATAHLNPKYFSQKFKKITGKNFVEYITDIKLSYAKNLLLSEKMTVTEICFTSGFNSVSNFMKAFKQNTGHSPIQYIDSFKKTIN